MDILQISYFSKVYETTNYAHAAESLCVSRQGLRKVMRNLEALLIVANARRCWSLPAPAR